VAQFSVTKQINADEACKNKTAVILSSF